MTENPRRTSPAAPSVERVRGQVPEAEWRTDALAGSHHSRLIDELRVPLESHDEGRAAETCGAICRAVLRDFAPGLILLAPEDRRRAQALATYGFTLFDFARQTGVEGERLAAINRWEFTLETALGGDPPGQPAFVLMAAAERERPWNREALDEIARAARQRAIEPRAASVAEHRATTEHLAAALVEALTGEAPSAAARRQVGALLRLFGLLALHDGLRRGVPALSREEVPDHWRDEPEAERALRGSIEAACARLESDFGDVRTGARGLAPPFRRAALYAGWAARALIAERRAKDPLDDPEFPTLGAGRRIALIARARFARAGR